MHGAQVPAMVGRVGTSLFPATGAVNPAVTAMASATRVREHLLSRLAG